MTWTLAVRTHARTARIRRRAPRVGLWRAAVLIGVIALWTAIAAASVVPPQLLPAPVAVAAALGGAVLTPAFWAAVGASLAGALVGLSLAVVVGIPLGVLTGTRARAEQSARFLLDFGRAFPAVALVGVLVLVLGRGMEMKVALIFIAVVFPITIQTQHGVRRIDPMIVETCAAFRIPRALYARRVLLPGAAPYILTGFRLAASVSLLVAISAELLTGAPGIGDRVAKAQVDGDSATAFAYIVTAGVLGWAINALIGAAQRRAVRWRPNTGTDE